MKNALLLSLSLLFIVFHCYGQELIHIGAPCKIFTGHTPSPNWNSIDFDDSEWKDAYLHMCTNPALSPYFMTTITNFTMGLPIYIRSIFNVPDPTLIQHLVLRIDWNGGFICYINGKEVLVANLSPDLQGNFAPQWRNVGPSEVFLIPSEALLFKGKNVFAIEWFPLDQSYGLLRLELLSNFIRGPFLHACSDGFHTICWTTPFVTETIIEHGPTPALGFRKIDPVFKTNHIINIGPLPPGQRWFYRVGYWVNGRSIFSPIYSFTTSYRGGNFKFAVLADVGSGDKNQILVAQQIKKQSPDFLLFAGDLVYPYFHPNLMDLQFFSIYADMFHCMPFFAVAGNHDVLYGAYGFFDWIIMPTNNIAPEIHIVDQTGPSYYYSFDYGPCHIVGLYVPTLNTPGALSQSSLEWLEKDLSQTHQVWKIIFLHHPLLSSGAHAKDDYNLNGIYDTDEVTQKLLPIAAKHKVNVIFTAHDHNYERFWLTNNVQIIVTGGGGGPLYTISSPHTYSAIFNRAYHFILVEGNESIMYISAIDSEGKVFDQLVLSQELARFTIYSEYNTPSTENTSSYRKSLLGFTGEALAAPVGSDSSLGVVYINEDDNFIYLGFEAISLAPHNIGVLFIDFMEETHEQLDHNLMLPILLNEIEEQPLTIWKGLDHLKFVDMNPDIVIGFLGVSNQSIVQMPVKVVTSSGKELTLSLYIRLGIFAIKPSYQDLIQRLQIVYYPLSPTVPVTYKADQISMLLIAIPRSLLPMGMHSLRLAGIIIKPILIENEDGLVRWTLVNNGLGKVNISDDTNQVVINSIELKLRPYPDTDKDGISDPEEFFLGLDPLSGDSDNDGLSDYWELKHGLNPLSNLGINGAYGDPDQDGLTNLQEFIIGTNPYNPNETLRIKATLIDETSLFIEWWTPPYGNCILEWALNIEGPWIPIFTRSKPSSLQTIVIPLSPTSPLGFIRAAIY